MSEKRELARREALAVWMAAAQAVEGELTMARLRELEVLFDLWWARTTRRALESSRSRR